MRSLYRADLAYIHDVGFSDFARESAPGILEMLASAGIRGGMIVDLGCGSGRWAATLLAAGYKVLGIDASSAMIARARGNAPGARFRVASCEVASVPRCAAVTALGEVLGYLPAESLRPRPYAPLFRRIAKALVPGGLFIFDLILRVPGESMSYRGWNSGEDWAVLIDVAEEPSLPLLRRDITTFRRTGRRYRRSEERHWLQLDERDTVLRELEETGFAASTSRSYGSHALLERRMAFCARKRGG